MIRFRTIQEIQSCGHKFIIHIWTLAFAVGTLLWVDSGKLGARLFEGIRYFARYFQYVFACAGSHLANWRDHFVDAPAVSFHRTITSGYDPEAHIDVLPQFNLIYVGVPKCASTTIKAALAALNGDTSRALGDFHTRRRTGLLSPSKAGLSTFFRIATDPNSLRFTFVRNPYARLVSAWADKFKSKPLVSGGAWVDAYLQHRLTVGTSLPYGKDQTLSFAQFAEFASATAHQRLDAHWNLQDDLVNMPGLELNFIGRVERFAQDFKHVLDRIGSAQWTSQFIETRHRASEHFAWQDYYTSQIAKTVYCAYERDFDRFGYPQIAT